MAAPTEPPPPSPPVVAEENPSAPAAPPTLVVDAAPADPREAQDWFLRLGPQDQEDFRRRWRDVAARRVHRTKLARLSLRSCVVEGVALLLFSETILATDDMSFLRAALALPIGAGLGTYWYWARAGRFTTMISTGAVHLALRAVFGGGNFFAMIWGSLLLLVVAATVGLVREMRIASDEQV